MPREHAVAFVTVPDQKAADRISMVLLEKRLAACVNQLPGVQSRYWWEGRIEQAQEILLVIKTRNELAAELSKVVKENHPYSVPEVLVMPVTAGSSGYLAWIDANVGPQAGKAR